MRRTLDTATASLVHADTGGGGGTLVFLHYWGGSARTWDSVVARLAPSVRCIALDQRGWGDSSARDGRHDLHAMADDVAALVSALNPGPFVLVGHSMGGKVAQIVAGRGLGGLQGLVLVAPAPPTPMPVPPAARAAMLASYQSREGVLAALDVLAGSPLPDALREQVVADTLAGHADAKRAWTEGGMVEDVRAEAGRVAVPVGVLVGDRDRVERADALRAAFAPVLPHARLAVMEGVGHLAPLEAPGTVAEACLAMLRSVSATPS